MASGPEVAIVVVNWNGWRDSLACLDSIRDLSYEPASVIVVDNGSTDESVEMIRKHHPDVELVVTGANLGFGGGCNVGIDKALARGSDFVWLLNNDAIASESSLGAMVDAALANRMIGGVGSVINEYAEPDMVQCWGGGRINMVLGIERQLTSAVAATRLDWLNGASLLLRADALRQVGAFDQSFFMYWEDADLGFRLRGAGWSLVVAESATVRHKGSATLGRTNPRSLELFNQSAVRFFRRHSPVPLLPIVLGVFGRMVRQIARGHYAGARAVLAGAFTALARNDGGR